MNEALLRALLKWIVIVAVLGAVGYFGWPYRELIIAEAEKRGVPASLIDPARQFAGVKAPDKTGTPAPAAQPKRELPPVPIVGGEAVVRAMPVVLDLVGSVQAIASIPVKSRVDTQLETVAVKEGDAVKSGQLLFTLDARSIRAQIRQAEAVIARDEAQFAQARSDLERITQLASSNTASKRDLEAAKTQVAATEATAGADRAAFDNLKVLESYYEIRSPIDGRVGSLPLKPGSSVRAADATLLATVNQISPVYVAFAVPQVNLPALRAALAKGAVAVSIGGASLRGPDNKAAPLPGRIAFVENALDVGSATLTVKATVDNAEERLLPGQFVDVRVTLSTVPDALVIPDSAVQIGQAGPYVYLIKPDKSVEMRPIGVAWTVDRQTVVAKGLNAGDRVVVDGQLRLFPGAKVNEAPDVKPQPGA